MSNNFQNFNGLTTFKSSNNFFIPPPPRVLQVLLSTVFALGKATLFVHCHSFSPKHGHARSQNEHLIVLRYTTETIDIAHQRKHNTPFFLAPSGDLWSPFSLQACFRLLQPSIKRRPHITSIASYKKSSFEIEISGAYLESLQNVTVCNENFKNKTFQDVNKSCATLAVYRENGAEMRHVSQLQFELTEIRLKCSQLKKGL